MDFEKLHTFYITARNLSVAKSARDLRIDKSSVSRRIKALEEDLGHLLFVRKMNSFELTDKGLAFYNKVVDILGSLNEAKNFLDNAPSEVGGRFVISTTHALASVWLSKIIPQWIERHPKLRVEVVCSNLPINMSLREADVALRPFCDSENLVQDFVRGWRLFLFASKDYIESFGLPGKPEDLLKHRIITYGQAGPVYSTDHIQWHLNDITGKAFTPYLRINSLESMVNLVKAGVGIAPFSTIVEGTENMVPILHDELFFDANLYFIHHKNFGDSANVKSFKAFLFDNIEGRVFHGNTIFDNLLRR